MGKRAIYFDTETTGLRPGQDRIIEIAAYDPEQDVSFCELANPGCPIPSEASAIHKITDEMVADAPSFTEVGARFAEFCKGEVVLIAHNNDSFDRPFLKGEFAHADLTIPEWEYLDTLKWARKYRPDLPRHTLQFLREVYGIAANTAHRALDDVMMLHKVFSLMIDDLSLDVVIELMNAARKVTHMPFGKHRGVTLSEVPKSYLLWLRSSGALEKPGNDDLKATLEEIGAFEEAPA